MQKIRIGIDVDGVLADLLTEWLNLYNKDYNDNLTPEDITDWNISKFVKPEAKKAIFDYLNTPNLYENIKLVDTYAQKVIENWSKDELFEVFIVTSCKNNPNMISSKLEWLQRFFPFFDFR